MSHSNRPHNIGQVLLNALAGAASSGQRAILQGVEQKRADTQQSFLNRLSQEAGGRSEERLGLERERLDLQRQRDENALIGKTSPNPDFISELDQARIGQTNARTALLEGQLGQLGQGGGGQKVPSSTFTDIFGQASLGFQGRQLGREIAAENPAFGKMIPEEFNFFSANTPAHFEPNQNITSDQIPIPLDTLAVLLQQTRQIAGGSQLTPATDLTKLGTEQVFPDINIDERLKGLVQRSGVRQEAIEFADADDRKTGGNWKAQSATEQEAYLQWIEQTKLQ